jgi:S-adenosylmethionine:tRNA ribosyltransferase-isomerase
MRIDQLDYELPTDLIAQQPVEPRDQSRLMVVDRSRGIIEHRRFADLPAILRPSDCLVLNDTRVLPARLVGRRVATGGRWEGLFLHGATDGSWELLCQTGGRPGVGEVFELDGGAARLVLQERLPDGHWRMRPVPDLPPAEFLIRHGRVPLPPYIRGGEEGPGDRERYQTVFAASPGAVAAPTAALHFTTNLLDRLSDRGVELVQLTLHVGLGTFLPVRESLDTHVMHAERGHLSGTAAETIRRVRAAGGRCVAVGTTCVRVLETAAAAGGLAAWQGETALFIRPPYEFRVVDAMITNFHLPRTTLLALVCAFAGERIWRAAYETAVHEQYRFFSYGDAMLIE